MLHVEIAENLGSGESTWNILGPQLLDPESIPAESSD